MKIRFDPSLASLTEMALTRGATIQNHWTLSFVNVKDVCVAWPYLTCSVVQYIDIKYGKMRALVIDFDG